MKDDYVHLFVKRPLRRSPIINRGRSNTHTLIITLSLADTTGFFPRLLFPLGCLPKAFGSVSGKWD